jgi:transposase-like protein
MKSDDKIMSIITPVESEPYLRAKPQSSSRRLNREEWSEAVVLWESGQYSLSEIAGRYGIRADGLQRRFKAHGIKKGKWIASVAEGGGTKADLLRRRIEETKTAHYQYAAALAKLAMVKIVECHQKGHRYATINKDIRVLYQAAKTLAIIRRERYALLALDEKGTDDEMPEFLLTELSAEQIEEIRRLAESGDLEGLDQIDGLVEPLKPLQK